LVRAETKLTRALLIETTILALTVTNRESILRALDEPPTDALRSCAACCFASTSCGCARGSMIGAATNV
jgi:hypothetical protein